MRGPSSFQPEPHPYGRPGAIFPLMRLLGSPADSPPRNPGKPVPPGLQASCGKWGIYSAADPRFYQDQEPPRCHFWILHRLLSTFMEIFRVVTKPPSRPWLFSCSLEVPLASMFVWLVDNLRPEKNNGNPAISFSLGQQHGLVYMERALPKFFSLSIVWSREFAPTF